MKRAYWGAIGLLSIASGLIRLQPVDENDAPWHLYMAREVIANHAIVLPDDTSFTAAGKPFVSFWWLGDVSMEAIYHAFSWPGLVIQTALLAALSTLLIGAVAWRASNRDPSRALIGAALTAGAVSYQFVVRPQPMSLVLLPLVMLLSDAFATAQSRSRAIAIGATMLAVQILWSHFHSFYFVAPCVAAIALANRAQEVGVRPMLRKGSIVLLMIAAFALAPGGSRYFALVNNVVGGDATAHIAEMQPIRWVDLIPRHFNSVLWLDLLLLLAAFRARASGKLRAGDWAGVLLGLALSMMGRRLRSVWAVLTLPAAARPPEPARAGRYAPLLERWGAIASLAGVLPLTALNNLERAPTIGFGLDVARDVFPADVADVLASRHAAGKLFNHFDDGGYLLFRLGPEVKIAIDGRTPTLFDDETYFWMRRALSGGHAFVELDRQHQPDALLIPQSAPLCVTVAALPEWSAVYVDRQRTLFVRNGARFLEPPLPPLSVIAPCAPQASIPEACSKSGGAEGARAEIESLVALQPSAMWPEVLAAELEVDCGDPSKAVAHASRALEGGTHRPEAFRVAARAFARSNDLDRAIEACDRAVIYGGGADALALRAHIELVLGRNRAALEDLRRVVGELQDATPPAVRLDLARALALEGDGERARIEARRAGWTGGGPGADEVLRQLSR
jgi:hypothetical protein